MSRCQIGCVEDLHGTSFTHQIQGEQDGTAEKDKLQTMKVTSLIRSVLELEMFIAS
jgi:hypothetical protein